MGQPEVLLYLFLTALCGSRGQSPLEAGFELAMQTKEKLHWYLEQHPHRAQEWNDRVKLSKVNNELAALANELADFENHHFTFDTAKNEACFAKMFSPCNGPGSCSGDCGNGYAPLICVQSLSNGGQLTRVAPPNENAGPLPFTIHPNQKMCPDSIAPDGWCCIGAYPFEDCSRNPLCKHHSSAAYLESTGNFSAALFAKTMNGRRRDVVSKGGDLMKPLPELSDADKEALTHGMKDCPPFEAPGPGKPPGGKCEDVKDLNLCNYTYTFLATGDYQPCYVDLKSLNCVGKFEPALDFDPSKFRPESSFGKGDNMPVLAKGSDLQEEEEEEQQQQQQQQEEEQQEEDVAAAPFLAPGGKMAPGTWVLKTPSPIPEVTPGPVPPPPNAPPTLCVGPTVSGPHCIDCPEFQYRNRGIVPRRASNPAPVVGDKKETGQVVESFKATAAPMKPTCNDPGQCAPWNLQIAKGPLEGAVVEAVQAQLRG